MTANTVVNQSFFIYFFHKVDLEKNRKHDLTSNVDNDWFLFNLFHNLDRAGEQGETLQIKQLIQFAIVTRISTFDILS